MVSNDKHFDCCIVIQTREKQSGSWEDILSKSSTSTYPHGLDFHNSFQGVFVVGTFKDDCLSGFLLLKNKNIYFNINNISFKKVC